MGLEQLRDSALFDKIYAAMLGGAIGDAMGGPIEGWHFAEIEDRHGVVEDLLPYEHAPDYHWHFSTRAGAYTDDTRLKHILCQAIVDAGGDVRRGDLVKACVEAYYAAGSELERGFLEEYALAGLYREEKLIWGGRPTNGFVMMNAPLGLVCPCDPMRAFALSYDVDFISDGYAKYSSAMAAAAVAAALCPDATITDAIDGALRACQAHRVEGELTRRWHGYEHVFQLNERLVRTAVEIAAGHDNVFSLRPEYYRALQVSTLGAEAAQTLAVALGMLTAAKGDVRDGLIGCVNYGRDNDSYASVAGAIGGALNGTDAIPSEWRATVEGANPEPSIEALSLDLTRVVVERQGRVRETVARVERLLAPRK